MESPEQIAAELSERIQKLESLFDVELSNEMDALKKAIMENTSASALLKDEDVGMLVSSLRRILGIAIASASAEKVKKPKAEKAKKLTAEELAAAVNSMSDDEW